jgi:hypothetical protein
MRTIRAFIRRVPAGPVVIALLMVGVLVLVNLYGTNGTAEHAAPSEPVGIPPQLPADEHGVPTPSAATDVPPSAAAPGPTATPADPQTSPRPADPPAGTRAATPGDPGAGQNTPQSVRTDPPAGQQGGNSQGQDNGTDPGTPVAPRLRVVSVLLTSDHAAGSYVRCAGRDEVVIAATILADGGQGAVVYQWVFDGSRAWPPDLLQFTGSGPRQQSLQIPWPVGVKYSGARIQGTVQLRILQPVMYAQTQRISLDVVCV